MKAQTSGRMKYILLSILPPIGIMGFFLALTEMGIIAINQTFSNIIVYGSLGLMTFLSYFLVICRNHTIEVRGSTVTEKNFSGKECRKFSAKQISVIRRNILHEIILQDAQGKKLLTVETNMSNRDLFLQWMEAHNTEFK